jgi:hypothetical protein
LQAAHRTVRVLCAAPCATPGPCHADAWNRLHTSVSAGATRRQ